MNSRPLLESCAVLPSPAWAAHAPVVVLSSAVCAYCWGKVPWKACFTELAWGSCILLLMFLSSICSFVWRVFAGQGFICTSLVSLKGILCSIWVIFLSVWYLFLAASSSACCLERFHPSLCECLVQTSPRLWPHSSPCAALAEVIFTPRQRVKNVLQKCTLGALLPPCVTASSFPWDNVSLRYILVLSQECSLFSFHLKDLPQLFLPELPWHI